MDDTLQKILDLIPPKWRTTAIVLVLAAPYLGRAWHSWRNGGGLRGVWSAFMFGTNSPKDKTNEN